MALILNIQVMEQSRKECDKFNAWMRYIHREKLAKLKIHPKITEPKNLSEWLIYIKQQRNSPSR